MGEGLGGEGEGKLWYGYKIYIYFKIDMKIHICT